MRVSDSDAFVFFGASGDLAYKQIFPALQAMSASGELKVPVIGVAKSAWTSKRFINRAKASIKEHGSFDAKAFKKLSAHLQYLAGEYDNPETFSKLREALGKAKRPLFYLAIPPALFGSVCDSLAKEPYIKQARVVVEKPFGRDLQSARKLNKILRKHFKGDSIFRIDHYLGKEPVQNLVYFRFANPAIESIWSREHIDCVQITMAEQFDVADRGKLYDELGALRDVVQNHLLQVVACMAMECPISHSHDSISKERARLIETIRPLTKRDIVRGQFRGYRSTAGVKKNSTVETFAALRFHINNDRWRGVPFFVRTGKCLPVTATEVLVSFKHSTHPVLDETRASSAEDGYLRFRLSPDEQIAYGFKLKVPGGKMTGHMAEMVVSEKSPDEKPPYQRLLGDAMRGESTLFATEDSVEAAWRLLDGVLDDATPVYTYAKKSWGPDAVESKIRPSMGWHNPLPTEN